MSLTAVKLISFSVMFAILAVENTGDKNIHMHDKSTLTNTRPMTMVVSRPRRRRLEAFTTDA